MVVIIVVVFVVMVMGNAVLAASGDALYATYARLVSGDLSVSATAETNFTVFGSDQLLIGEYLIQPTLSDFAALRGAAADLAVVDQVAGLVSSAANVRIGDRRANKTVFGVDFASYRALFPELELVAGRFPDPGEPGMVVQADWENAVGEPALLAGTTGRSFVLREVPVTGVFDYPVDDELLNAVVLVNADTARALNGYLYGALDEVAISQEDQAVLDSAVDDLFGAPPEEGGTEESAAVDLDALLGGGGDTAEPSASTRETQEDLEADRAREAITGAWNFLLVGLHNPGERGTAMRLLEAAGYTEEAGFRVRDWYRTVGGNASLVRYLQLFFNAGLVFVAVGAAIIATNALVLSVLERQGEIGTMRALGAGRGRVAALISLETAMVVLGAAALGVAGGVGATAVLNNAAYVVENQYIAILFGGAPLRGEVGAPLVAWHLAAGLALAVVAVVYPLKKALAVSPREAMAA